MTFEPIWMQDKVFYPAWMQGVEVAQEPGVWDSPCIFAPRWMAREPFYPLWTGCLEIIIEIEVPVQKNVGGSAGYEVFEYSSSETMSLYIHSILVSQRNSSLEILEQPVQNYISNIQVPKMKNVPKVKTVKVNFK